MREPETKSVVGNSQVFNPCELIPQYVVGMDIYSRGITGFESGKGAGGSTAQTHLTRSVLLCTARVTNLSLEDSETRKTEETFILGRRRTQSLANDTWAGPWYEYEYEDEDAHT